MNEVSYHISVKTTPSWTRWNKLTSMKTSKSFFGRVLGLLLGAVCVTLTLLQALPEIGISQFHPVDSFVSPARKGFPSPVLRRGTFLEESAMWNAFSASFDLSLTYGPDQS